MGYPRGAAALAVCVALAVPGAGAAQDAVGFAQQRYLSGTELFRARQYERALAEFRASLALLPSPNTRLFIARCLQEQHRVAEAVPEFETALREATERAHSDPRYAPTRETAERELRALLPRIGRLTLTIPDAPPATRVRVEGRELPLPALGLPLAVTPGRVSIAIDAPGFAPVVREVQVDARAQIALEIRLVEAAAASSGQPTATTSALVTTPGGADATASPPPATAPRIEPARPPPATRPAGHVQHGMPTIRAVGWTSLAIGVVGLAAGGGFWLANQSQYDLATRQDAMMSPELASTVERGRMYQTLAYLSLGVGALGAALGAVCLSVPLHTESRVRLGLRPDGALTLAGRF